MTTPNQYQRQDPYQVQVQKQTNAALEAAAKKKQAADKAKKLKELEWLKTDEARNKAFKLQAEKDYATKDKAYRDLKAAVLLPGSDGGTTVTPAEQTAVNYLGLIAAQQKTEVTAYTNAYTSSYNKRIAVEKDLTPPQQVKDKKVLNKAKVNKTTTKNNSKSAGANSKTVAGVDSASSGSKVPSPLTYYYNAPMIRHAYLNSGTTSNSPSPQQRTSNLYIDTSANYTQGLDAWTGTAGAKGVIQMDVNSAFSLANSSTYNNKSYDGNLYGFKFLYNPKEVSMTWGVAEGQNWEGIAAGLDPGTAPSAALQNSTITFSLLLNRTLDMHYLDSNGLRQGVTNPYLISAFTRPIDEELAELYEKGTMYDMEYLFKTLNGLNSNTFSGFIGDTSDQGWLQGFAVELHLGNRMRYLVRVTNVEINHAIFDERMVPILSYVNLTCVRFPYVKAGN
jgi:hypothetical protein